MTFKREYVTPELAQEWLNNMILNRKINNRNLAHLISEIEGGGLKESTDMIGIRTDGKLCNGQHRLMAIVKTKKPQWIWVAYNVPADAVIDRGRPRTLSQSLYMQGLVSEKMTKQNFCGIAKNYLAVINGKAGEDYSVTDEEIGNFVNDNEDMICSAYYLSRKGSNSPVLRKTGCQVAILAALLAGVSEIELEDFCKVANTGIPTRIGIDQSAALILRKMIDNNRGWTISGYYIGRLSMLTENAIKDFLDGRSRSRAYRVDELKHVYF